MPEADPTSLLTWAIHNFFDYNKADVTKRQVRLLQEDCTSLGIGLSTLLQCLPGAYSLSGFTAIPFCACCVRI
jgi:hypothetical protein